MASQNLNVGTSANSNDGDTLRAAFIKLKQMFAEVYGQTYSEQGDLSGTDFKINESKLQLTASAVAGDDGKVLTYDHATGGFSWEDAFTGTIGDITGIVAGDGLTGSSLSSDEATINVVAGTGITVAADSVSLASTVQDEISLNTLKTGITATQAGHIAANNSKVSDQTVVLTGGTNVTVTGTYPSFTIASDDVVGAVTSVNTAVGAVVLDTADIAENTNLYYTEARVAANSAVAANTSKTGITSGQAGEITANTLKDGFPGFGTTAGTSLEGDTALLALGTSGTTALAGDTALLQLGTSGTTALAGDTALLQLGTSGTTALAGDTTLLALGTSGTTALAGDTALLQVGTLATEALAGNTTTITPDQASKIAANDLKVSNVTHSGDVTDASGVLTLVADKVITSTILDANVTTDKIADDAVDYDKLGTEFTTSTGFTAATDFDVDWSTAAIFTAASSIAMDLDFTNAEVGQVKTIIVTDSGGTSSLTFDSSMTITTLNGSYSATAGAVNYIQAVCTATDTFFLTISQAA